MALKWCQVAREGGGAVDRAAPGTVVLAPTVSKVLRVLAGADTAILCRRSVSAPLGLATLPGRCHCLARRGRSDVGQAGNCSPVPLKPPASSLLLPGGLGAQRQELGPDACVYLRTSRSNRQGRPGLPVSARAGPSCGVVGVRVMGQLVAGVEALGGDLGPCLTRVGRLLGPVVPATIWHPSSP